MKSITISIVFITLLFIAQLQTSQAASSNSKKRTKEDEKAKYEYICGRNYPKLNNRGYNILNTVRNISGKSSIELQASPQHKAMCWLIHSDKSGLSPSGSKVKERYALATLWYATTPDVWQTKTNWLTNESICNWFGITCDTWGHVVKIDLGFNALAGIIPHEIGWLSYLEEMRLTANDLQGVIPTSIGLLKRLKILQLNMNGFFGLVPAALGKLTNLRELHLYGNYFNGKLPKEIGNMVKLEIFDVYANFLEGNLPKELAKLPNLRSIFVNDNELRGTIPSEFCKKKYEYLVADCRGPFPEVVCTCCTHCCNNQSNPKCQKVESKTSKK